MIKEENKLKKHLNNFIHLFQDSKLQVEQILIKIALKY